MEEETLLSEAAAPEATTESTDTTTEVSTEVPSADDSAWYLSEGVAGQGEAPDWFKAGKYATIADQAQAYNGLESKLGSFTGAPKDGYETVIPEGMNVEIPSDDPLMTNFNEWAQAAGLSQDAHSELLGVYLNGMAGEQPDMEAEMKRIGPDANQRIQDMVQWGKGNLDENEFETLQSMATTAEGFQLLERMKSFSRETQVSAPDTAQPVNTVTKEALYDLMKDERYQSSPAYRDEVKNKFDNFFGKEPAKTIRQ
jgi:hypothetical protein